MNDLLGTGAGAMIAGYGVALFKMALPNAASWLLVSVAVLVGIGSSVLVSLSSGEIATAQNIAAWVIRGIFSAAVAAGLTRTDGRAEEIRKES